MGNVSVAEHLETSEATTATSRRQFLTTARNLAIGASISPLATFVAAPAAAAADTSVTDTATGTESLLAGMGPEIELTDQSIKYLEKVLSVDMSSANDALLNDLFNEGQSLHLQAMALVVEDGYRIQSRHARKSRSKTAKREKPASPLSLNGIALAIAEAKAYLPLEAAPRAAAGGIDAFKIITIIISCLGVPVRFVNQIFVVLDEKGLISALVAAVKKRSAGAIGSAVKDVLKYFLSKEFLVKLTARIGKKTAGEILAKITSRFVPFVGWAIVVGCVVIAITSL